MSPITSIHPYSPPVDRLSGSGASSLDEEKKQQSYETTLEADELSFSNVHVFDNEKLKD